MFSNDLALVYIEAVRKSNERRDIFALRRCSQLTLINSIKIGVYLRFFTL
jgi:hypothetical protein